MREFLTIRGRVRGVEYEAWLKPANWPAVGETQGPTWLVSSHGLAPFYLVAVHSPVYLNPARAAIEKEIERRHARREQQAVELA